MDENVKRIQDMLKHTHYHKNQTDEYIWTISCADYFYYNKNIGLNDIRDGFIDGGGDGGIDFIYDDDESMYLIQGKKEKKITYNKIKSYYRFIIDTIHNFEKDETSKYNEELKRIYRTVHDKLTNPKIKLVLFTNASIQNDIRVKIESLNKTKEFKDYELEIYDKDDIETQQQVIDEGFSVVKKGFLELADTNYLNYSNKKGEGAILTIKANSLKNMYETYGRKGLFGYNLREQINYKQLDVDGEIEKTIKDRKEDFWFFNNGIIIGCSDYEIKGDKLELKNFSIINGAQTTTKIGNSPYIKKVYDFNVVCKVIKSKDSLKSEFINKISEASNTQKPIIPRDIKSNSDEQKKLKNKFLNNGKYVLDVEIKRGVKSIIKKGKIESWQKITNAYLGQIIMATQYQRPGTARSNPKIIFERDTYDTIFALDKVKSYDYNSLFDFVRLAHLYDEYKKDKYTELQEKIDQYKKIGDKSSENKAEKLNNKKSVCGNSKLTVMAIISFYIKKYYFKLGKIDFENSNDLKKLEDKKIKGDLSLNYTKKDYEQKVYRLFNFINDELLELYNDIHVEKGYTSHSNFFKLDGTYRFTILPKFNKLIDNPDKKEIIDECILIFDADKNKKD